jgi:hypothetical protein
MLPACTTVARHTYPLQQLIQALHRRKLRHPFVLNKDALWWMYKKYVLLQHLLHSTPLYDREVLMTPSKQPPTWFDLFAAWQPLLKHSYRLWGNYLDQSMDVLLRNQQLLDFNAQALETGLRSKQQIDRVVERR